MTIAVLPLRPRRRREKIFGQGRGDAPRPQRQGADHGLCARLVGPAPPAGPAPRPADPRHAGGAARAAVGLPQQPGWAVLSELRDDRPARPMLPGHGVRGDQGARGGRHPDLGEPADPGAVPRARPVRADGAALAPGPHQQCLCVSGPVAVRAGRRVGAKPAVSLGNSSKSENPPRTQNQDFSLTSPEAKTAKSATDDPLEQALTRLKQAMGGQMASPG